MSLKSLLVLILVATPVSYLHGVEATTPKGLEYCTVCHGSQLKGNENIGAPRLSGLPQWYIKRQLQNFKQGIRGAHADDVGGAEMKAMVGNLSEQEIQDIALWVTQTQSHQPLASIEANTQAGQNLYQACAACHGANAQGNEMLGAPALAGLNDWYLVTQLNHFRLGIRGANSSDIYGQQMKAASNMLSSEQDVANIAAYINQLK